MWNGFLSKKNEQAGLDFVHRELIGSLVCHLQYSDLIALIGKHVIRKEVLLQELGKQFWLKITRACEF